MVKSEGLESLKKMPYCQYIDSTHKYERRIVENSEIGGKGRLGCKQVCTDLWIWHSSQTLVNATFTTNTFPTRQEMENSLANAATLNQSRLHANATSEERENAVADRRKWQELGRCWSLVSCLLSKRRRSPKFADASTQSIPTKKRYHLGILSNLLTFLPFLSSFISLTCLVWCYLLFNISLVGWRTNSLTRPVLVCVLWPPIRFLTIIHLFPCLPILSLQDLHFLIIRSISVVTNSAQAPLTCLGIPNSVPCFTHSMTRLLFLPLHQLLICDYFLY